MTPPADSFIPTRGTLLSRLKQWDDQESWHEFFNTYWKLIYGVAIKGGLRPDEAEEVVQETVISVAKNIAQFKYDPAKCSFKTWLLNLTRWRIIDQFRKRPRADRHATGSSDLESVADPARATLEAIWEDEWQKNIIDAAMERVKRQVKPLQYQIFDLYVFKKWPVLEIARKLRINVAQVYLATSRIGSLIKKEVRSLETKGI